jgi:hypothetical protein
MKGKLTVTLKLGYKASLSPKSFLTLLGLDPDTVWNSHYRIVALRASRLGSWSSWSRWKGNLCSFQVSLHAPGSPGELVDCYLYIKVLQFSPAGSYFHFHRKFHRKFYGTFHFILDNLSYLPKKKKRRRLTNSAQSIFPTEKVINLTGALHLMVLKTQPEESQASQTALHSWAGVLPTCARMFNPWKASEQDSKFFLVSLDKNIPTSGISLL